MDISIEIREIPGYYNLLCPFVYDPPYYPYLEISKLSGEKDHKYDCEIVWCGGIWPYIYKGKLCYTHSSINTIFSTTIKGRSDYKKISKIVVTFNKIIEV